MNSSSTGWWLFALALFPIGYWSFCRRRKSAKKEMLANETALGILGRRYAAGEISSEEYDERRARLEGRLIVEVQSPAEPPLPE